MTNEEIDFRCEMLVAWLQGYGKTNDADMLLTLKARAETAEVKLAKAREGLKKIASCEKRVDGDVVDIARSVLAELEESQ
jgi:hypothetical protein